MNLNCILIGDCNVGKTHLLSSLRKPYRKKYMYIPTIGVDFHSYGNLRIWDTSGHPRFMTITKSFIRSSDLCILCYKDEKSYKNLPMYIEHVNNYMNDDCKIMILSFCKDVQWEVEGMVLANTISCDFKICDVEKKESCMEFFDKLIPKPNVKTKELTTMGRDQYCWWNWW